MEKIYMTNNICESLNSHINFYLQKEPTSNADFINIISKRLINSKFTKKDIIRHDYTTRTIIKLINDLKLNDNPRWVKYNEYIEAHKQIINKYESNLMKQNLDDLINLINGKDLNKMMNMKVWN